MSINEYTRLLPLSVALEEDLSTWGPGEGVTSDRAQFRSLTKTAIRLYEADESNCKEEFAKIVEHPLELVKVVQKLARFAANLAECRKQDIIFRRLDAVAHTATSIRLGLEELMDLYRDDPSTLRSKQLDKVLHWQL
ncbi:hypothetical protein EXIGLDRAFT_781648 [Exidia glandulosa HHB12029]|uniref:Uncharacterized protein n=1 Tax=Exidia glandulosa HHB12029 TaxID=1314781 RepID=A0A165Z6V9_EXIGL|nr:hypothetical protein EXIGLDRAFT_781648 [Exidia glandulosa HHB12029]